MKELTKAQQDFLLANDHPLARKKHKEQLDDRETFLFILCHAFAEEKRKIASTLVNLYENEDVAQKLTNIKLQTISKAWESVIKSFSISEDILEEFAEDVPWTLLTTEQALSENFIRSFKSKLNWKLVSQHQILSESFIIEFSEQIDWNLALAYQSISIDFFIENKDRLQIRSSSITLGGGLITIGGGPYTIVNGNGLIDIGHVGGGPYTINDQNTVVDDRFRNVPATIDTDWMLRDGVRYTTDNTQLYNTVNTVNYSNNIDLGSVTTSALAAPVTGQDISLANHIHAGSNITADDRPKKIIKKINKVTAHSNQESSRNYLDSIINMKDVESFAKRIGIIR